MVKSIKSHKNAIPNHPRRVFFMALISKWMALFLKNALFAPSLLTSSASQAAWPENHGQNHRIGENHGPGPQFLWFPGNFLISPSDPTDELGNKESLASGLSTFDIYITLYIYIYTYMYMYLYMHVCVCMCIYMWFYMCKHIIYNPNRWLVTFFAVFENRVRFSFPRPCGACQCRWCSR